MLFRIKSEICGRGSSVPKARRLVDFARTANAGGSILNCYTGQVGGSNADSATASVYSLITNNADVIKGVFNGHQHNDYYTEIVAKTSSGDAAVIPQYTLTGGFYNNGSAINITVQ